MAKVKRSRLRCGKCGVTLADVYPGPPAVIRQDTMINYGTPERPPSSLTSWPYMDVASVRDGQDERLNTIDYHITCLKCRVAYVVTVNELTEACADLLGAGRRNLVLGQEVGKLVGSR